MLLVSGSLRFYGLGWGTDRQTGQFHAFHPDERTVVENARWVGEDLSRVATPYGNAPLYILWSTARVVGLLGSFDPFDLHDNATARFTFVLARGISALLGTLTVLVVFLIGRRLGGFHTGLLAAFFLAFAPGHIQQNHYYTVDGPFTFWATLAVYLMLRMPQDRRRIYLACGVASGVAAGTRLGGVWLAPAFLLAHLWPRDDRKFWQLSWRSLFSPGVGLYVGTTAGVFLLCEPYLLLDPARFFSSDELLSVMGSVEAVRGGTIYIWTLFDFSTTRYLYQITHLLRYALGLPLEAVSLLAVAWALWSRRRQAWILLAWLVPYYLVIGALVAKPVRYTTPLMAVLAVLGAWVCVEAALGIRSRWHKVPAYALPLLFVGMPTVVHGLSMMRVYHQEDSRIVAARWVHDVIPPGASVLAERGGFPTNWMVDPARYHRRTDQAAYFLAAEGAVPYSEQVKFSMGSFDGIEWIVSIEENRTRQFEVAPDLYPIACSIYSALRQGRLGFAQVASFSVKPGFAFWEPMLSGLEPTTTAFDHPTVAVYRLREGARVQSVSDRMVEVLSGGPQQPDRYISDGLDAYRVGDWPLAAREFGELAAIGNRFVLSRILMRAALLKVGDQAGAAKLLAVIRRHSGPTLMRSTEYIMKEGLTAEGIELLERFTEPGGGPHPHEAHYHLSGLRRDLRDLDRASAHIRSALGMAPARADYWHRLLAVGASFLQRSDYAKALPIFHDVLKVMPDQAEAWYLAGVIHYNTGDYSAARTHLRRAVTLSAASNTFRLALARTLRRLGNTEEARVHYSQVLDRDPQSKEARDALSALK